MRKVAGDHGNHDGVALTQLVVQISRDLRRRVKLHTVERDTTLTAFVTAALAEKLAKVKR